MRREKKKEKGVLVEQYLSAPGYGNHLLPHVKSEILGILSQCVAASHLPHSQLLSHPVVQTLHHPMMPEHLCLYGSKQQAQYNQQVLHGEKEGFNCRELIERSGKIVDKFWSTRNQRNPKIHVLALAHSQMHEECNRADSE